MYCLLKLLIYNVDFRRQNEGVEGTLVEQEFILSDVLHGKAEKEEDTVSGKYGLYILDGLLLKFEFHDWNLCIAWMVKIISSLLVGNCKWASSWENLFMPYANNKDADQPAQFDQHLCYSLLR